MNTRAAAVAQPAMLSSEDVAILLGHMIRRGKYAGRGDRSVVWRLMRADAQFPRPVRPLGVRPWWRRRDVEVWMEQLQAVS